MRYLIVFLVAFSLLSGCFPKKQHISDIELERTLKFFQKKRYELTLDGQSQLTDQQIFQMACENFHLNPQAVKTMLRKKHPEILNALEN